MMNGQHTNAMFVRKLFQLPDDFIVAGIAVCLAACLTDAFAAVADLLDCEAAVLGDEDCVALVEQSYQGIDRFTFCLCWHSISPPDDFVIGCRQ